ncbi:MAG: amidohydrolase family protein [Acidimicrobiales bacterium]
MAILIAGGTVVNSTGTTTSDVLIDGERIVAVVDSASDYAQSLRSSGCEIVDATDRLVIPGGVDVHVHLQLPMSPQATSADTFETGSQAAAWGGTTTLIDFAGQIKGTGAIDAVEERLAEADGQCAIDYGLHLSMGDVNDQSLKEMRTLIDEGLTSFKFYMAYPGAWYSDDGQILRAMQVAADTGAMVMMHAENGIAIDVLRDQAAERGNTGSIWHGKTRPAVLEAEATHRAVALATVAGAPLYRSPVGRRGT